MNRLQELVYNEGERLVPYVTHGDGELIRHRSSYAFFHNVIQYDIQTEKNNTQSEPTSIVDLGFGTGYGCSILSGLPNSRILGVDIANECEAYARQHFERRNVDYHIADLAEYIPTMLPFDYAVSRGVLEHLPAGMDLIERIKFRKRLMIDVPYDEVPVNDHHVIVGIKEQDFAHLPDHELFYEDINGTIFDFQNKPDHPNMIMLVISAPGMAKVSEMSKYPISAITSDAVERLSLPLTGGKTYHYSSDKLLAKAASTIRETDTVLDIGCGIVPMNYFRPKLHFMVEPWKQYNAILSYLYRDDNSVIVLKTGALESLRAFADDAIDSIFMLDVIEHLDKEEGRKVLIECERVARQQIVVFTPLGFMPQTVDESSQDAWGLQGISVQEHKSGWLPEDFGDSWSFYICEDFHKWDFRNREIENPYGAFFAIKSISSLDTIAKPSPFQDFRRPLPSEIELQELNAKYSSLSAANGSLHAQYGALQSNMTAILSRRSFRLYNRLFNLKVRFLSKLNRLTGKMFGINDSHLIKSYQSFAAERKLKPANNSLASSNAIPAVFESIYLQNSWGSEASRSGSGSDLTQTAIVRIELPKLIAKLGVRSILDLPCGDFNWMCEVALDIDYIGVDIVHQLINANIEQYQTDSRRFMVLNALEDDLPCVDLIFCRDMLVHLSTDDIKKALGNMKRSGSKWILTTTFAGRSSNHDINTGQWRPINLQIAPFNLPNPEIIINENCTESDGQWADKSLGLWRLETIPFSQRR
jgi:ubiquinone/menaquinone biosynthesis C-methylase UbiE